MSIDQHTQPLNSTSKICGFSVENGNSSEVLDNIMQRADSRAGGWVVTLNLEMLSRVNRDQSYRQLLDGADMYIADGMPLVWASSRGKNRSTLPIKERTTGVDLVDWLLRQSEIPAFALIGGEHPHKTLDQYPGAGDACRFLFDGFINVSDEQVHQFADEIINHDIKVVFLALGVPKQDQMAIALRNLAPHVVYIGVGGTFKMLAPEGRRAPEWMQSNGLEWLYRLSSEPKRLWKRYLAQYPPGALYLLKDTFLHSVGDAAGNTPVK